MAFLWAGIGFGEKKPPSDSNDQEPRNLQEGLLQIGTQAWHILVHENNNIGTYEDDKNKKSDCITSLVEVAATSERASNKNQQLVMLIPHVSSRITQPKERKRSEAKVSILFLYFYRLFSRYSQLCIQNVPCFGNTILALLLWLQYMVRVTLYPMIKVMHFYNTTSRNMGTTVAQWLRCCATNRKVVGTIPAGVIGIFH